MTGKNRILKQAALTCLAFCAYFVISLFATYWLDALLKLVFLVVAVIGAMKSARTVKRNFGMSRFSIKE